MKPITNMSTNELNDLVSFRVGTLCIFYSEVSTVSESSFIYKGESIYDVSSTVLAAIRQGKLTYEAYKLHSTSMNVDDYIRSHASTILTDTLASDLSSFTAHLKELSNDTLRNLSTVADNLDSAQPVSTAIINRLNHLQSTADSIDLDSLHSTARSAADSIAPYIKEFDRVTDKLKSLFR